jgi:hypothetical protein
MFFHRVLHRVFKRIFSPHPPLAATHVVTVVSPVCKRVRVCCMHVCEDDVGEGMRQRGRGSSKISTTQVCQGTRKVASKGLRKGQRADLRKLMEGSRGRAAEGKLS